MAAGFGALCDQHVDTDGDLALGVRLGPDERADEQTVLVREVDDIGRGRTERVDEHLHAGVLQRDLDLTRRFRVDVQTRGLDHAALEILGERWDLVTLQQLLDEIAVALGDHRVEVREVGLVAAALAHVLHGHDDVDAVGLAVDVLVDPVELDLELFGSEGERTQHSESTGAADRGNDVAAVREGEDRKFDVELVGDRCTHDGVL